MCTLTEHDKGTSAVLPVDRCPTDRRQKPWGEASRRQEVLPPPTPPNTHKGLVSGGLLPSPKSRGLLMIPGEENILLDLGSGSCTGKGWSPEKKKH